MKNFSHFTLLFSFIFFIQCRNNQSDIINAPTLDEPTKSLYNFSYAKTIELQENEKSLDYIIHLDNDEKVIKVEKSILPLKNLIVLSSSSIGFLSELEKLSAVKAVYGAKWMYSPKLHELIADDEIKDEGNAASINLESILSLNPDAIIAYSDPNQSKIYKSLEDAGILVLYVDEYREESPLGKAEFIKLFGALTGTYEKSEQIFNEVEENYNNLKYKALASSNKPTVFAEIMRGDIWYMPGGKSFVAKYFEDAGTEYLWNNNDDKGSLQLNFEQVFSNAGKADIWLNAADLATLEQLEQAYTNHNWFQAYQEDKVYSIYHRQNETGANDYFEKGTVRADWVLKDLIKIAHPELIPNHKLYFYQKLK